MPDPRASIRVKVRRDKANCHCRKTATEYDQKTWYKVVELYCEVPIGYNPTIASDSHCEFVFIARARQSGKN
jgi:hypothetical protein